MTRPRTGPYGRNPTRRIGAGSAEPNRAIKRLPFRVFQLQGQGWTLLGGTYEQASAEKLAGQNSGRVKVLDRFDREVATFMNTRRIA